VRSLEPEVEAEFRKFVATGGKAEKFFEANPDLGALADYDLGEPGK